MARFVFHKIDRFITNLTLFILISGGLSLHILTALTIKSYYGSGWGYASFLLPGFSELYLLILQTTEHMYNYMTLIAGFAAITAMLGLICLIKNTVKSRLSKTIEN